jgi:hypothetical protein
MKWCFIVAWLGLVATAFGQADSAIPHLERRGNITQLIVDNQPFFMLAGEVHNSSAASLDELAPVWPRLAAAHLNTVVVPVYWELLEPKEGQFDFTLVDGAISAARGQQLRLVLLWFGSWKNSASTYVPGWMKTDYQRFPRMHDRHGRAMERLSTFSQNNLNADAQAFAALMRHIKETDAIDPTVLMVQVENEVGVYDESRDFSADASQAYAGPVPPEVAAVSKKSGTWEEVFGAGPEASDNFMAWQLARFIDQVAAAGKAQYPLPMYVNAALNGAESGAPMPKVMDVWRAGAPNIDVFSPDVYDPKSEDWCRQYTRAGNPLFVPESRYGDTAVQNLILSLQYDGIGYSPFGIDGIKDLPQQPIAGAYGMVGSIAPLYLRQRAAGQAAAVWLDEHHPDETLNLGGYAVKVERLHMGWTGRPPPATAYGLVMASGPDEFVIGGNGIMVSFSKPAEPAAAIGLLAVNDGLSATARRLNGDETDTGNHVLLRPGHDGVVRVSLYSYR